MTADDDRSGPNPRLPAELIPARTQLAKSDDSRGKGLYVYQLDAAASLDTHDPPSFLDSVEVTEAEHSADHSQLHTDGPPTAVTTTAVTETDGESEAKVEPNAIDRHEASRRPNLGRFGPFLVLEFLARGGMGAVFKARDLRTQETVALKVPSRKRIADPNERRRFLREARLTQRLVHPNICAVREVGQHKDRLYLAMQFVAGQPLRDWLPYRQPTLLDVIRLTARLARAVHYAHDQGVIHRDIKPDNLMVTADDEPVLLDFGLARDPDEDASLTKTGICVGTPAYMAPEQAFGEGLPTRQTDVYGLGALYYELLTGQPPYVGKPAEILLQLYQGPPRPPRDLNPDLPTELEWMCARAMARDASKRYATAAEFADELEALLVSVGRPISANGVSASDGYIVESTPLENPIISVSAAPPGSPMKMDSAGSADVCASREPAELPLKSTSPKKSSRDSSRGFPPTLSEMTDATSAAFRDERRERLRARRNVVLSVAVGFLAVLLGAVLATYLLDQT